MRLTIDNLDGRGAVDYSAAVCGGGTDALRITRRINEPSVAAGMLLLAGTDLKMPVRRGRVVISSAAGTDLFTGYLATEPVRVYAGVASEGAVYRLALRAVSDEWLLDKQAGLRRIGTGLNEASGSVLDGLLGRLGPGGGGITSGLSASGRPIGVFEAKPDAAWSVNAGALAGAAYGAYRVLNGAVTLAMVGGTSHAFADGDGSLNVAALRTGEVRELANDVTVSGALEPVVYWNELFAGDGTTAIFELTGQTDAVNGGHAVLIDDDFSQGALDPATWVVTDPGSYLGLGGGGFTMRGGNGLDGQTTLTAIDAVELGGTVVIELGTVQMSGVNAGVLGGLFPGGTALSGCFAGFSVRQVSGQTVLVPLVDGTEVGTAFSMQAGHSYTLRLRVHCPEMLRVKQSYFAMSEGGFAVNQFGGGTVAAPAWLVFEVSDLGLSSNTPVTVLYDGEVANAPASCSLVAVDSVQMNGSVGWVRVNRTGTGWVRSTDPATGEVSTRLVGVAGTGVDCTLMGTALEGKVTFFPGREPAAGEVVSVSYRGRRRAVARLVDEASVAAEAAGGGVGTARWLGHVVQPAARSTEDCEAAAAAVLSFAADRAAAVSGSYTAVNPLGGDIWPGDVLALRWNEGGLNGLVRQVVIVDGSAMPERLTFEMDFANDWAEGLGLTLSETVAADALLPWVGVDATVSEGSRFLTNLRQMTVTSATSAHTALVVDAGVDPPAGGGFEVRRRDSGFGLTDGDLVLRSPVRGFTIPVVAAGERFFVRMYDGSSPALYSRASSAVLTHLPVG